MPVCMARRKRTEGASPTGRRTSKADSVSSRVSNSSEEDEYEVERIVGKRIRFGKAEYRVKWAGYPESENTWQAVDTMECPDLIEEYEKGVEQSLAASKSPIATRRKGDKMHKVGARLRIPKSNTPSSPVETPTEATTIATAAKTAPASLRSEVVSGDWEDMVVCIDTVTRADNGDLLVWVQWKDGYITEETASEANVRCPQKVIQFYESRLRFPGSKRGG